MCCAQFLAKPAQFAASGPKIHRSAKSQNLRRGACVRPTNHRDLTNLLADN